MAEFKLPDVGEGLTEAEIVTWRVKEGDTVAINDIVVEIETAKSLVELPSPFAGVVQKLMVPEGETVPVGTPIIAIGDGARRAAEQTESDPYLGMAEKAGAAEAAARREIDLSNPAASGGGEGESPGRPQQGRPQRRTPRPPRRRPGLGRCGRAPSSSCRARSSPASRRPTWSTYGRRAGRARDRGAACRRPRRGPWPSRPCASWPRTSASTSPPLAGTGPTASVTREDVQARRQRSPASTTGAPARRDRRATGERETREPIKGVRKMMGQAMVGSAFSIPHVTEWVTIDVTRTMEFVDRLKSRREFRDVKVSPLLVLARAVMLAMRRTPEINSWWDDAAQEVVYKSYVNLGIAAATPRGLVVPNVKDAEQLSLLDLAAALNAADRDRARREDPAGRDERRHVHDHQRRRLRRRQRNADHQPRRVRDPLLRRDQASSPGWSPATTRSSSAR